MRDLIRSVVTDGTAKNAQVAGFSIGGKTGTSEKIDVLDENGQPTLDNIVSFVGIAPMDDPEYIVLVALDTPSRETGIYISGGVMAAPTVGAVLSDILPYLGVERHFSEEEIPGQTVILEDYTGFTPEEAEKILKKQNISAKRIGNGDTVTGQLPEPGKSVPGGSEVILYLGEMQEEQTAQVPNFIGMNRQQANDAALSSGLYILVTGNPEISPDVTVTAQSELPDTSLPRGSTVTLEFTNTKVRD